MFEAVTTTRQPRSALNWLRSGAGASLLADVVAGRLSATHEALDAHPRQRAADYLRHMLTAGGVLPPRDEGLARAEQWAAGVLGSIPDRRDRRLIQAYITWHVMPRLRASAGHDHRYRTRTAHARNNVRVAVRLLAWLRDRGISLPACGQADIDLWLGTGPAACQARDFLQWAADRRHCTDLDIPAPAHHDGTAASQDHRWAQAARLLHDDSLDLTDRAAGCLLLLYGQQLSRIAAMTASQVTTSDGEVLVRFGQHDLPVPEPLAVILTDLIRTGRSHTGIGSTSESVWLFPGGLPGQPITAARLGQRLRNLGIYAMSNRRAALTDLAAQLPAAILADLLRLSPRTAVHWARQAGADWSGYAADIARTGNHQH